MKKIGVLMGIMGIFAGFGASASAAAYYDTGVTYGVSYGSGCNVAITRTLSVGDNNDNVSVLQQLLARSGYLNTSANGNFGPATRAAVKSFQWDNGIPATGVVGELTRNAINERLCDPTSLG